MSLENITALKNLSLTRVNDGERLYVSGYYTENDGGGGIYVYDSSSTAADNGGSVIAPSAGTGRYLANTYGEVNVRRFGARGNGSSDDTAAIQAAINSGASSLIFPTGTYMVSAVGLVGVSNQNWYSDGSGSVSLKASAAPSGTDSMVRWVGKSNFSVNDITFDFNGKTLSLSCIVGIQNCADYGFYRCKFVNFDVFGVAVNGSSRFKFDKCYVYRALKSSDQNQSFLISSSGGAVTYGVIENNVCINSGINASGNGLVFDGNTINGFGFGAGITTEQDANTHSNVIKGNTITGGDGVDINGYRCGGIENWGARSVIASNVIFSNSGAGMDQGGANCSVSGNVCFNNGTTAPGSPGISGRYGNASYNSSGSVYSGNRCFDTSGASGTQTYGYQDQSASLEFITLNGNSFKGNKTGDAAILSSVVSYLGQCAEASATWEPGAIAVGESASTSVTVAGATLGDYCSASLSVSISGASIAAHVQSANTVTVVITNNTGGIVTLGSGTVRVRLEKPINHASI